MLDSGRCVSNSSRCRIVLVYLTRTWFLYSWSLPRYSHNYALFYQLLDSNLFTHRNSYAILREASSETYGPRVYLLSYLLSIYFIFIFTFCIYIIKYQKYIYLIILSLLDLTFASGREGIDNPFIALVAISQFVCVGAWDFWGASD